MFFDVVFESSTLYKGPHTNGRGNGCVSKQYRDYGFTELTHAAKPRQNQSGARRNALTPSIIHPKWFICTSLWKAVLGVLANKSEKNR